MKKDNEFYLMNILEFAKYFQNLLKVSQTVSFENFAIVFFVLLQSDSRKPYNAMKKKVNFHGKAREALRH